MVRVAGHIHGSGEISPAPGSETIALDAAIKPPEGAVAYQARTAGSGLDGADGWIVVATERQERATPHVGRLCVVRIKGGPTVHGAIPTEPIRWNSSGRKQLSRTYGLSGRSLFCGYAPASQRTRGTGEKAGGCCGPRLFSFKAETIDRPGAASSHRLGAGPERKKKDIPITSTKNDGDTHHYP